MEQVLEQIYFDPANPSSFGGVDRLYQAARTVKPDIKLSDVKDWLSKQDTYTLHRPIKRKFKRSRLISSGLFVQNDLDLADVSNLMKSNEKIRFLLVAIDTLSKRLYVQPLKSKSASDVVEGFEKLWPQDQMPRIVRSDCGKEFTNKSVQLFFKENNIHNFTTSNEVKAHMAERVIRTLRSRIQRFITHTQNEKYIHKLQSIVEAYNESVHSSIGISPNAVTPSNERLIWWTQYWPQKPYRKPKPFKFNVGDYMRITYLRHAFTRGYDNTYSGELFKVIYRTRRDNIPVYKLEDMAGEKIMGTFYTEELTLAPHDQNSIWRIEKTLKTRKRKNHPRESYVKWIGFSDKFNSWILTQDIVDI
jgi:hypothetical protein